MALFSRSQQRDKEHSRIRQLEHRWNTLQERYHVLTQKLPVLRLSHQLEPDPAVKHTLQQRIQQAERKRQRIEKHLTFLEEQLPHLKSAKKHPQPRIHIHAIPQGLEISFPRRHGVLYQQEGGEIHLPIGYQHHEGDGLQEASRGASVLLLVLYSLFPLAASYFSCVIIIRDIINNQDISFLSVVGDLLVLAFINLLLWSPLMSMVFRLFGTDKIVFSRRTMRIHTTVFGITIRKADYTLPKSTNLRKMLEDLTKTIGQSHLFTKEETYVLVQSLADMLKFRCHLVTHILFGVFPMNDHDPETTLHNPDVSDLSIPFGHLHQILIETATYDFHQVERFLTYLVNYMDRDYVKQHVEVVLYGDSEQLHPNLRNSLTNLCKGIHIYTT